jgi:hypothetical protein
MITPFCSRRFSRRTRHPTSLFATQMRFNSDVATLTVKDAGLTDVIRVINPKDAKAAVEAVVSDGLAAARAVSSSHPIVIGLDTESKPMVAGDKPRDCIATLQLASQRVAVVFHVASWRLKVSSAASFTVSCPIELKNLLEDGQVIKAGQDMRQESRELSEMLDIGQIRAVCDTYRLGRLLTSLQDPSLSPALSLRNMCERYLGYRLDKPTRIQRANWQNVKLMASEPHVTYAALDAWTVRQVFLRMIAEYGRLKNVSPEGAGLFSLAKLSGCMLERNGSGQTPTPFKCEKGCTGSAADTSFLFEFLQQQHGKSPEVVLLPVSECADGTYYRLEVPEYNLSCTHDMPFWNKAQAWRFLTAKLFHCMEGHERFAASMQTAPDNFVNGVNVFACKNELIEWAQRCRPRVSLQFTAEEAERQTWTGTVSFVWNGRQLTFTTETPCATKRLAERAACYHALKWLKTAGNDN